MAAITCTVTAAVAIIPAATTITIVVTPLSILHDFLYSIYTLSYPAHRE
jgi:hypothetical protein